MPRIGRSHRFLVVLLGTGFVLGLSQILFSQGGARKAKQTAARQSTAAKGGVRSTATEPAARARLAARYSRLPLAFERNAGQSDASVLYLSRGLGYTLFLTSREAALALEAPKQARNSSALGKQEGVVLGFAGANPDPRVLAGDELPGQTNYLLGRDSARWSRQVSNYGKVTYADLYPGVNVVFYGTRRQLEQDWVVAPGADPAQIAFKVTGATSVSLSANGDLQITLAGGELRLLKPVAYEVDGAAGRAGVPASFALLGRNVVGFKVGAYDRAHELVIDPVLSYGTYLGGTGTDEVHGIAVDAAGDIFVAGDTTSTDFQTTEGAFQPSCKLDTNGICQRDAFVTEFAAGGASEVYSTYLGGSGSELAFGLALDASGDAYVVGQTSSDTDFPTANGYQTACNTADGTTSCLDGFVSKLSPDGSSLMYSTYLGGSGADSANAIAVDASGNAFVAGQTSSADFPVTSGVIQTMCGTDGNCNPIGGIGQADAFVAEINTGASGGSSLVYATYLGGSGIDYATGIAIDATDDAFIAGGSASADLPATSGVVQPACKLDASSACEGEPFVAELNPTATALNFLTYLGGSGGDGEDTAHGIALDSSGNVYVAGQTSSADFPVTAGAFQTTCGTDGLCNPVNGAGTADGFVTKLNSTATALMYSTYLGGSGLDLARAVAVDSSGNAYVSGGAYSTDFPTFNPLASGAASAGGEDAFVAALNSTGSGLIFSTYLGGSGNDEADALALDASHDVFVAGSTSSPDLPTLNPFQAAYGGGTRDAFVAELGSATSAFAELSAASLDFGSIIVGTSSAAQAVTVTNSGNAALAVSSASLGGSNPGDFGVTADTCTDNSVAPDGTCEIDIVFTPASLGARAATLTINSNASNGAQTVTLTGSGVGPLASLTPAVLSFTSQIVNTSSGAQKVTLTSTGTATLSITGIAITGANAGDYSQTNTCGQTLAVDASCTISVTFTPTAGGTRTATLSVSDNAPGSPQTVALTGQGADFATVLQYDLPNVTIPPGQTAVYNLQITPLGGFNQSIDVSCSGAPKLATCTAHPSSITPVNGVTPVKVSVDVSTTAPGFAPAAPRGLPPFGPAGGRILVLGGLGLAALGFLARKRGAAVLLALAMFSVVLWASCGGNSVTAPTSGSGTPSGTYTLTITATSSGLTHSTTGTLIIK